MSSAYTDGASGAPAGVPIVPTILNGYAVRPPWKVAGVDYAVGIASGTGLKNPSQIALAGVSVDTAAHTVTVTGNNVVLNGYDFSLAGGWEVIVQGAGDTVENSNFVVGPNQGAMGTVLDATQSASNFSFLGNDVDGANVPVTAQLGTTITIASSGTLTMRYNDMHNSGGDMVDLNASTTPQTDLIQYNLFENIGVNTAHADTIQWYNTDTAAGSDVGFNTVYQNVNQPGAGNGALVPLAEGPKAVMNGLTVNNDTLIQTAAVTNANFTMGFYADEGGTASNVVIHDLYIDPTGVMGYTGSPWFPTGYYGDNLANPTVMSNVTNMVTGAGVPVPSSSSPTAQGYYTYGDAAGYSPTLSDVYGVTASAAGGTLVPGKTITFTVHLDEPFMVTGTPTLGLNDGGTAVYSRGSGTNALAFNYTVGNSDKAVSALGIAGTNLAAGAAVTDSVGNAANLAGAVVSFASLAINPTALQPAPTQPMGYADGSSGAPAGTPLLPTLLNGYAARPAWKVAGVDYAVGVPSGTSLANPSSISLAGVSVDTASHTVTISGSNVTLSGYDFSGGGGWGVDIAPGATNVVIKNCHFLVDANNNVPINAASGSGNLTVLNNTIDGGSGTSGADWALVNYDGSGTFTAKYNAFLNAQEDAIDFNSGTMTTVVEYNVFDNLGTSPGSHPDPVQYVGVTSNNSVEAYNTIYQPNPSGMQGVQLQAQSGSTLDNTMIENNTIVAKASSSVAMSYSIAVIQNSGNTINGAVVDNNYIDYSGAYGPFYPPSGSNLAFCGNVNMATGATIASPGGTAGSDVCGVSASPASGTQNPGTTIALTLTMDQPVFVTGSPTLSLNDGGAATYAGGSGTGKLLFNYTIGATDAAVKALAVTAANLPNGAAIADAAGSSVNLSGALQTLNGLVVDPPASGGSTTSTITLNVSEDAYQGDAQFIVKVDGTQVGGTMTASALHSSGDSNVFTLTGNWASGSHQVAIQFLNDAYGGSASLDRNLYVNAIAFNGQTESGTSAALYTASTHTFSVGGSVAAASGPADTVTVHLSEDAYNGNAQFQLLVDGKVVTTPQQVVALHAAGAWEDLTFSGNFGAGNHTIGVQFTNDAYGGTASTDRNLYVNGIDVNGTHYGSGVSALYSNGTVNFAITTTH